MKRYIMGIVIVTGFIVAAPVTRMVDTMVAEIKKPRRGVALTELETTPDPFVRVRRESIATAAPKPKKKMDLRLNGIVNNRAYINGVWYKKGDEVSGFILEHVGTKEVLLMHGEHEKHLYLHGGHQGIIMVEESSDEKR